MLVAGLIVLIVGAELLVRGAVAVALKMQISPLVIGMTIVSIGTSAPELLVSIKGVLSGYPDVSVGTIVGSNISNLGLVLGVTVLIFPIEVNRNSIRVDWPFMMFSSILFYFFVRNGVLSFWQGLFFVVIISIFIFIIIYTSRRSGKRQIVEEEIDVEASKKGSSIKDIFLLLLGIVGLYFGSGWLVDSVVHIAGDYGVSEKLISISVVAFGTSLPELVTSAVAAFRKKSDIAMGNLIGSNVFNILAILGITAMIRPMGVSDSINNFDIYVMLFISFILLPIMLIGKKVGFFKGLILIAVYGFYIYYSFASEISGIVSENI